MSEPRFEEPISDERSEFEKALAKLQPLPSRLDRDRLMYEAGRASAFADNQALLASKPWHTGKRWLWPAATAAMTGVAAVLAMLLVIQQSTTREAGPIAQSKPVADSRDSAHAAPRAASASERISRAINEASYLSLRQRFMGLDGSFTSPEISAISASSHEPWGNLLEMRQRFLTDPDSFGNMAISDSGEQS